jgi:ribose 5-phosphate isomerase B
MGERVIGLEAAKALLDVWLDLRFDESSSSAPKVAEINRIDGC